MDGRQAAWLLAAVLALGAAWVWVGAERAPAPIESGAPAPGFTLPALAGGEVSLESLRGRVVLVNFWATWCKPCEDEMPAMERLYRRLAPQGFELLAVSVDTGTEEVAAFQERLGLSFPILLDPEKDVADAYQSFRFPETFLVDRDGTLVTRYIGPREWDSDAYRQRIERLLAAPE